MQNDEKKDVNSQERDGVIKNPTFEDFLTLNRQRVDSSTKKRPRACTKIIVKNDKKLVSDGKGGCELKGQLYYKKHDNTEVKEADNGFNYYYEDYKILDEDGKIVAKVRSIKFLHNEFNQTYLGGIDNSFEYIDVIEQHNELQEIFNSVGFLELKKADDNKYTDVTGTVKVYIGEDKQQQVDAISFVPTGMEKPIYMDMGDSFNISTQNGKIIWCHCPFEMHKMDNVFHGIKVQHILEGTVQNQMLFNKDGTPKKFWLTPKIEQKICGITLGEECSSKTMKENPYCPIGDIEVYNINEFDFYAKQGEECCGETIDNKKPIRYKKVKKDIIHLTFTNNNGEQINKNVNEKGEDIDKIYIKKIEGGINNKFLGQPNINFNAERIIMTGKVKNNKIDGLSVDKNIDAQFIMGEKGDITQIYRLDKQNFPLEHDNNHEIIYTKQANGKNYVNYYDKNGKQIIEPMEKIKARIPYAKRGVLFSENGEYLTDLGLMKYDKVDKTFKFYKNLSNQDEYYKELETLKQELEKLRENYNKEKQEIDLKMIKEYNKKKNKTNKSTLQTQYNVALEELRKKYNTAKKNIEAQERKLISTRMKNYDKNNCKDLGLL